MTGILNLEQYLELLLGPRGGSAFESNSARRNAWHEHQAELLPMVDPGSRPWGWWQYDAAEPVLPRESELAYLERCRLLSESERLRLQYAGTTPCRTPRETRSPRIETVAEYWSGPHNGSL